MPRAGPYGVVVGEITLGGFGSTARASVATAQSVVATDLMFTFIFLQLGFEPTRLYLDSPYGLRAVQGIILGADVFKGSIFR